MRIRELPTQSGQLAERAVGAREGEDKLGVLVERRRQRRGYEGEGAAHGSHQTACRRSMEVLGPRAHSPRHMEH